MSTDNGSGHRQWEKSLSRWPANTLTITATYVTYVIMDLDPQDATLIETESLDIETDDATDGEGDDMEMEMESCDESPNDRVDAPDGDRDSTAGVMVAPTSTAPVADGDAAAGPAEASDLEDGSESSEGSSSSDPIRAIYASRMGGPHIEDPGTYCTACSCYGTCWKCGQILRGLR